MIRDVRVRRLRAVVPGICLAIALHGTLGCESFGPHVYRVPSRAISARLDHPVRSLHEVDTCTIPR